jgi:hypothetical protein
MATGFPARVVAVVAIFIAAPAHAERRPVAVISLSEDENATALARELYQALGTHPDLKPLGVGDPVRDARLNAALQGPYEDENQQKLREAREDRADADTNLGLGTPNFFEAARLARAGMTALAEVAPSPEAQKLYADLMFDLGVAQLGQGDDKEASRSFGLVRRLDPDRKIDRAQFVQEIADAYDATANVHAAKSPLTIKGSGTVWIDGVSYGEAPHKAMLDDGIHFVQLTGPEREPRGERVRVPQTAEIEVAPAPATEELKVKRSRFELANVNAKDSVTRASAVKRLAALLGVGDAVIISKAPTGELMIQTWRDNEQGFSAIRARGKEPPIDLLTPLAPPRPKEPEGPKIVIPTKPLIVEKPWYKTTWFKASAATGVVAVIVSAVLIARRDDMIDFAGGDIKAGMK